MTSRRQAGADPIMSVDNGRKEVSMRLFRLAAVPTVVMGLAALPGTPALAAGDTATTCAYVRHDTAEPGFGSTDTRGRGVGSGEIRCVGVVSGEELSGEPGVVTFDYSYGTGPTSKPQGDNCQYSSGSGIMTVELPLSSGKKISVSGPNSWVAVGLAGEVHGMLGDSQLVGVEQFALEPDHLEENCVTEPIRHFIAFGQVVLSG
jgi:hypothetical protein